MALHCDNADTVEDGEQHFIFKLENKRGTCLDPNQYLHIEPDHGNFIYDLPSCGNIVKAMIADHVSHKLEFTVKAKKKLKRGWKLAIYSVYGRRNDLRQRSTIIGRITFEDKVFEKKYFNNFVSYEYYRESHYKSTYWEEAKGETVKIGTVICTIVAVPLSRKKNKC